ncbi:hypothetical protein Tco_0402152 [Tanacetum coccineum]
MTTLAEHIIVAGAENRPPMLEKSMLRIMGNKFVTDVKLAKSLYTTNYDQLYAYLSQHERHDNEVRIMRERYPDPLALATIQDGRVIVQQVQGRQTQSFVGTGNRGIATTSRGNYVASQAMEKLMLIKAQEVGQILDEEQLAFIADPGIEEVQVAQQTIPHNSAFQIEDLDAYDLDCDDLSSTKADLMENLSSCDSDVLSEVPYSDTYLNDMINQDVQEMPYSKQTHIVDIPDNEITSDSNIIPYSQYLQESQDAGI